MSQERAILAGGCFWGMQDLIRRYEGVITTRVGYTGGDVPSATYRNHGTHAEAIEITFDPARLSYREILAFFFQIHDPTTLNRQGNDVGPSYRSAIFYTSEEQSASRKKRSPSSTPQAHGRERSSLKSQPPASSGKRSSNTKTTWKNSPTGTLATTSAPTGSSG
jgi:methionine-S-sulfoxide reductase